MEVLMDKWGLGRASAEIVVAMGAPELARGTPEVAESSAQEATPAGEEDLSKTVYRTRECQTRRADDPPRPEYLRALVSDCIRKSEVMKIKEADDAVVAALDAYQAKGDRMAAASAQNLLGWIRRAEERYPEAGRRHMQALALALQAGGPDAAESEEAEAAYTGLSIVQITTQDAATLLEEAVAAADAAGVPSDSPGRVWGERRLRANARLPGTPESRARAAALEVAESSPVPQERNIAEGPVWQDELEAQVKDLMDKGMFERANGVALVMLEGYRAKSDKMAAASVHNLLGEIYSAQEQYREAARSYVQALALALQAGGPDAAGSEVAEAAYAGISIMQTTLAYIQKPQDAEALLRDAVAAADAAGIPRDNPDRVWGESRLRHAVGAAVAAASASV